MFVLPESRCQSSNGELGALLPVWGAVEGCCEKGEAPPVVEGLEGDDPPVADGDCGAKGEGVPGVLVFCCWEAGLVELEGSPGL